MDGLRRDINLLSSENRFQRKSTLEKLYKKVSEGCEDESEHSQVCRELLKPVLRVFSDELERCRDYAVKIVKESLEHLHEDSLSGIIQVVVGRIGVEPVPEVSEDVRLELMKLATRILEVHPHEIGPKGLVDYYAMLVVISCKDEFPDVKKECSKCIIQLCLTCPKQVTHVSKQIAPAFKPGMRHKHSAVRKEMVKAFVELCMHGAHEIMTDERDELEQNSTIYFLNMVVSDQSAHVRMELLLGMGRWMTLLVERLDYHHKLLPMILTCMTDPHEKIRAKAAEIMKEIGRYHLLDHEDNSVVNSVDTRRITYKDIEWYADEVYPDMTDFEVETSFPQGLPLVERPGLGERMVVADSVRRWLPDTIKRLIDLDWSIPLSKVSRRQVAIRCIQGSIRFIENNAVQFLQSILDAFYKTIRDDDALIRTEVAFTVELLGKFISPEHYIPLIIPQTDEEKYKMDQLTAADIIRGGEANKRFHTWFSASTTSIRANIVLVFDRLLKGSKDSITETQISAILSTITMEEFMDFDQPALLHALLDLLEDMVKICSYRNLLATGTNFDNQIFLACLLLTSSVDRDVKARAQSLIQKTSTIVTSTEFGIYEKHFQSILDQLNVTFNVSVIENLLTQSGPIQNKYTDQIVKMVCTRLASIEYTIDTHNNLNLFMVFNQYVVKAESNGVVFEAAQLELILRSVIIPHGQWNRGNCALQFRRACTACLGALIGRLQKTLFVSSTHETSLLCSLMECIIGNFDTDDPDIRMSMVQMAPDAMLLPIWADHCKEMVEEMMKKLDDHKDLIRIATANSLKRIYEQLVSNAITEPKCREVLSNRSNLVPWVEQALVHMDDMNVTLQETIYEALVVIAKVSPSVVGDLTAQVKSKHHTVHYCDKLLSVL